MDLPHWLVLEPVSTSNAPLVPTSPDARRQNTREVMEATFEGMFERALSHIIQGGSLKSFVNEDSRIVEYEAFWRWVRRNPDRYERFKEAQEMRTELLAAELIEIADGINAIDPTSNDSVSRDKLRIDTRWRIMSAHNRLRYGENKSSETTVSISVSGALQQAETRVLTLRPATIDHDTGRAVDGDTD